MDRIIITGGGGFIGSNLAEELQDKFSVYIIDNFSTGKEENLKGIKATVYKSDLCDYEKTLALFKIIKPKYVFHCAALPRIQYSLEFPVETFNSNVLATQNILEASRKTGVKRVIYSSSSSVYGDQEIPLVETMTPKPVSLYALHKYMGELLCKKYYEFYGLETVSLRYFNVYGKRMATEGAYKLVLAKWLEQKKEGQPLTIYGDGTQTRDFTNVKDVVQANLKAMECVGDGDVFNIGSGVETSMNELASLISNDVEYIKNPRSFEEPRKRANIRKAELLLKWEPKIMIQEGINDLN